MKKYASWFLLLMILACSCKKEKTESPAKIGDYYQGGYLFYIDPVTKTGLVMAPPETERPLPWGCTGTLVDIGGNPTGGIGWGAYCTSRMVYKCTEANSAGQYCYNLVSGGYSDWYLPTLAETLAMLKELAAVSNAKIKPDTDYWVSLEADANRGTYCKTTALTIGTFASKSLLKEIRAVRTCTFY